MISRPVILLCLALFGTGAAAQTRASGPVIQSGGKVITVMWGGLTWNIPERFFFGVRTWTEMNMDIQKDLWIQSGWNINHDDFRPTSMKGYDIMLDIHGLKIDNEDPGSALELIHRIHLPFTKVPIFASAKFNGMIYLGSSSSFHYFKLDNEDAHVGCHLIVPDRLMPPKVAPDVLSRKFTCETVFLLPYKTFVWVRIWGINLNEAAPAFNAAHRLVLSFIR